MRTVYTFDKKVGKYRAYPGTDAKKMLWKILDHLDEFIDMHRHTGTWKTELAVKKAGAQYDAVKEALLRVGCMEHDVDFDELMEDTNE